MAVSQWHKLYTSDVGAPPAVFFGLLADMPNYGRWLPGSTAFGRTTDVEPYPVRLGSRYHDGKPDEPGKDWWGTVIGFQPPGSLDFHHTITPGANCEQRLTCTSTTRWSLAAPGHG